MDFFAKIKSLYVTEPIADETLWHKCYRAPLFSKIAGSSDLRGQIWRRKVSGKWEYCRDCETDEDYESRW